jgi:rod shape-determining protein MreC
MQAPMLDFIVGAQSLREGERVITSGDGGLYPRGIPVGVARRDRDGQWRVALAAAQQPIDFVRILPYIGIAQPEDTAPESAPPPPNTGGSSVADISNETMTPAPSYQPPPPPPPPRPRAQTTSPAQPAAARTTPAPPPSPLPAQVIAPQPQPDTPSPAPEPQE